MCGITGYFDLKRERRIDAHVLQRMADTIVHRGPDSNGYLVDDDVALGFRRLSIIDLSSGDQPMFNEDRSIALTCNGEIYNYRELRKELLGKGHTFRTNSDVEVLLHLYEELGPDMVRRLNGQFAFVIYDRKRRSLLLARDHFGIAPLYYTIVDGLLIWGSEIRAILAHPRVPREVDLTGLDQVLSLPGPIAPRTMFRGIQSLPPGHYMTVQDARSAITEYWDLDYPRADAALDVKPERDHVEQLSEAFERSVRYRLQADVPVGFYLSGGLDSSLIAAMIRKVSPTVQRHSFSVGFAEARLDEARYQRLMAKFVDSAHHEVRFDESEIASRLSDVVYHAECPLKETYNTASLALSRMTRDAGVRVVLNGEGSDELFAGYVGYRFDKQRASAPRKHDLETLLGDELRNTMWGDADLHYEKDEHAFSEIKAMLYAEPVRARMGELACHNFPIVNRQRIEGRHIVHKRSYLDFKLRLAGHLIADHGDRMAMANSVEARFPFLDIGLVELCTRIPPDLKLAGFTEKHILKQVGRGLIPDEIIDREKFGFVAPGSPYLLQRNVEWVQDLLSYDRIKRQGYFDPDTVEVLKRKYARPGFTIDQALEDDLLIVVLTFGLLLDRFELPSLR
jgi:asparagine synthase (glutamine-hydrolysing)